MSIILVLSSVTYAMKAQDLLRRENICSSITRSPDVRAIKGCGYGIKISCEYESWGKQILQNNGINIIGSVIER